MKARPSMSEPFVPFLDLFFVQQTYIFNTLQLVTPNVTSPFQLPMTSVATASQSTPLRQLSPVNLRAHRATALAVTTTVTTVLGVCKRTRPQGCPFRSTLPLQG